MEENAILTPIYKSNIYQYHECSDCKKSIKLEESILVPLSFEEKIKYCPFCGKKIIRYAEPKFIEEINWEWLEEFSEIIEKTYRYLEYRIHCKMEEKERRELRDKSEFGKEYFKENRWIPYSNGNVCDLIHRITLESLHYTTKNKLEKEFKKRSR